jgi:Tol biopolymer transport system component
VLKRALLAALLVCASTRVLCAKERILLHRIGPSQSTLFIAKTDGSDERPLLPNSGFDYNASFSADGKWVIFTSERGGSADIYRAHASDGLKITPDYTFKSAPLPKVIVIPAQNGV